MSDLRFNVLILCTGNSARSIVAEALLNDLSTEADADIRAYSAGSRPRGDVHPMALAMLSDNGLETAGLRSKSWDEFALPSAPSMDVVITVCDSAAGETCPIWPGTPVRVHWGLPDPAAVVGSPEAVRSAFQTTFDQLRVYMMELITVAGPGMDREVLQARLQQIHHQAA